MTQYFEVRVKYNNPSETEAASPELIQELLAYQLDHPITVVSVAEDVQARGMGESIEAPEPPE